ncbi:MAG: hypothetical protein U5K32_08385 [Bacteroidales bacterium]|nr:hypothetical protein [Bacteroidales bacterium]
MKSTARPTDQVRQELLAIKGVGSYAAANLLMLLGRYDFVPVDSWARKMVSREWHRGKPVEGADVEAAFERWGAWKGLVYWFWNWTAEPIEWLLETDQENPAVRYFALRDLLELPESHDRVRRARSAIMREGPVPVILEAQEPDGYWVKPGSGYSPKYRSTVWSVLLLAELGADPEEARVRRACEYLLDHARAPNGAFSVYQKPVASGALHCLNGNLVFALQRLGFGEDPRVGEVRDWLARSIVGEEFLDYYGSGVCAPGFACGVNEKQPCAWGANKALRALLETPEQAKTPLVERALERGAQFLLSRDPAVADYPYTERVSSTWFKLGFPLTYWSDVLETVSNLVRLGYGQHPRVAPGLDWVRERRDDHGRWRLENSLRGKMWVDIERQGQPSKWITLRALKVLKAAGLYTPDS